MRLLPPARPQRAEVVVLERDPQGLGVHVVLEDAAVVPVIVDIVPFHEHVARGDLVAGEGEEPVARVVQRAVAHGDVLPELQVNRRGVVGVALHRSAGAGEGVRRPRAPDVEVLDREPLGHHGYAVREGHRRAADLDHAPAPAVIVELGPGGGAVAVEDRPLAERPEHTPHRDRGGRRPLPREHELLLVGRRAVVDEDGVSGVERLPGDVPHVGEGLARSHLERERAGATRARRHGNGHQNRQRDRRSHRLLLSAEACVWAFPSDCGDPSTPSRAAARNRRRSG